MSSMQFSAPDQRQASGFAHDDDLPLAGLRVLDLSQGIAGPYCGLVLRQQGAQVIKVEPPQGDWSRHMGRGRDGLSAIFLTCNAGKQGVCIDAGTPEGRAQLQRLASHADVIVQNYRPGVADRMGVGWETLSERKPSLVYVSISGWGGSGPMVHMPALDTTMQAATGMMHANCGADGKPRRVGLYVVDYATGLYAAQATLAAVLRQARTGRGRHVEVAMLQAAAALQNYLTIDAAMFPGQDGVAFNAPTGLFDTRDGRQIYVSMLNDAMFQRLALALGMAEWITDTSLHASSGRRHRAAELNQALGACIAQGTLAHWTELLARHDILFAPARRPDELPQDPQVRHLKVFADHAVPGLGTVPLAGLPGAAGGAQMLEPAPRLGEHNAQWLGQDSAAAFASSG
ncbi:CaiB/BaiF CoA transferase family protein [Alicycliphilus denitrificans]|uniref:CaiB/BaiF CoA transferase family protein n=1 Tax=Alicycliphilus denitrificans TaxID=179636 RepID=UPI003A803BAB